MLWIDGPYGSKELERKEEDGATNKKFPSSSDWQSDKTNIFLANRTTDNHSQV